MQVLSPRALLTVWEEGLGLDLHGRAARLCGAAFPDLDEAARATLPLAQRDALLAALRCRMFGAHAECHVACPACGEALEFPFDLSLIARDPPLPSAEAELNEGTFRVRYRLPSSADLDVAQDVSDLALARSGLLAACVLEAFEAERQITAGALPAYVLDALERDMERRDPQPRTTLELCCAACAHGFTLAFDVASFLWQEIDRAARLLLREVASLARAYGWSEDDVLRLSARRRRAYLELAGE